MYVLKDKIVYQTNNPLVHLSKKRKYDKSYIYFGFIRANS